MARRIRSKDDRRQAAWEQRLREEELEDLLDMLRCEWSQHLASFSADDMCLAELANQAAPSHPA